MIYPVHFYTCAHGKKGKPRNMRSKTKLNDSTQSEEAERKRNPWCAPQNETLTASSIDKRKPASLPLEKAKRYTGTKRGTRRLNNCMPDAGRKCTVSYPLFTYRARAGDLFAASPTRTKLRSLKSPAWCSQLGFFADFGFGELNWLPGFLPPFPVLARLREPLRSGRRRPRYLGLTPTLGLCRLEGTPKDRIVRG